MKSSKVQAALPQMMLEIRYFCGDDCFSFFFWLFFFPLSLFAVCSQWHLVDAVHRLPGTVPHLGHPSEVAFAECVRLEKFKHHPSAV